MNPEQVRSREICFLRKVHKIPHSVCPLGQVHRVNILLNRLLPQTLHRGRHSIIGEDSAHVVNIIEDLRIASDRYGFLLATLDVDSPYLSIPQIMGIRPVLQRILPTQPPHSKANPRKNMLWDLLNIVFRDNIISPCSD